jgi:hypothetical protein
MNSRELLEHLQNGARLKTRSRYKIMSSQGKRIHELTLPSGEVLHIQHSTIKGLFKANKLHAIDYGGGNYDYYLEGQHWYDVRTTP